ncbi:MAG TPA: pilus assembly protein, partial [Myxococcaceae bacterium]|nr:pilus assembly protein [Myxococcaceae bacterium]
VETSVRLGNRFLPRNYLDRTRGTGFFQVDLFGGRSLSSIPLKSRLTLIADGWTLNDGGDAVMIGARSGWHHSGSHPSGLYLQVSRMTFLGIRDRLEHVPALGSIAGILGGLAPNPMGTFVVSHNYGPDPRGDRARRCDHLAGYPQGAIGGLNNLARFSQLDGPRPDCFDTAPFRDQSRYEDSLYLRMFGARGGWFMGCKNPGADDPSAPSDSSSGDQAQKVDCE